jgi:UDP-glucose:(glucosyl)LPS alpha-1,2-glucosyltransferase
MALANDSHSTKAMGGTELVKYGLIERMPADLLSNFQIFVSRVEEALDETKIRILWLHDLPGDPASEHLKNGGWKKFHRLVFVSNWQMQAFIQHYNIPWSVCIVMQNAIVPIDEHDKPTDKIRLAYWATPHRGLNILIPVFQKLCEKYDNIELDVYSSFKLYGWEERDKQYQSLFDTCNADPRINYYGTVANETLKENLKNTHIFAYPSTWPETSCICLMEAMSAGLLCVHPNLAALYETGVNWTNMYQWNEDPNMHASHFYAALDASIEGLFNEGVQSKLLSQKSYANVFYNWQLRSFQWEQLLLSLVNEPREIPQAQSIYFEYKA